MVMVILFNSVANSDTQIIHDTPNPGDTTTIETITTGNPVTTDNLLSQKWNDGSWTGTMFPDSSDINESIYLTGKDNKYAESTINTQGILTEQELQQGLTSNLSARIRWWNPQESTVTMSQTATNGIDTTTQSITFEDTTNHNYQFNTYQNNLTISPNTENTHGTLTARFSFDIQGNANYNGGHSGVDVIQPELKLNYQALSSTTVTTVEYCWEKTPTTCPAQDEIADIETFLDTFEDDLYLDDIYLYEEPGIPEFVDIEYSFNPEIFEEEEFEIEDNYLALDDFFFEEQFFEDDYYEEPIMEEFIPEDIMFEEIEFFDEPPPIEEVYEMVSIDEEMFVEEFTEEMQEEFIDEVEEYYEEIIEAEPIKEEANEIEEQPDSESIVADESVETEGPTQQEEDKQEPTEVADVEGSPVEEPSTIKEDVSEPELKSELDIKIATLEKVIKSQIKDSIQQTNVTLNVINEIVSREMIAMQPDMSSYANMNQALFDARDLPQGNQDFFMQVSLATYDKTIYGTQINLVGTDPVVQYQIKLNEAKSATDAAYIKLKGLMDARSNQ
tara:strand:+ start:3487 stop:5160 length:1674 start_codon:yes stop_codon:yes gene_type:complete